MLPVHVATLLLVSFFLDDLALCNLFFIIYSSYDSIVCELDDCSSMGTKVLAT